MQDAVERLLGGPERLDGFYYDSRTRRYFPIPRQGGVSWEHYKETKSHYEQLAKAESEAQEANCAKPELQNCHRNLWHTILDIRLGGQLNAQYHHRKLLCTSYLNHSSSFALEMPTDSLSRAVVSPAEADIHYIGTSHDIIKCSVESGELLRMAGHTRGSVSGLSISPSGTRISISFLMGALEFRDIETLEPVWYIDVPGTSKSVWCHSWINSNCFVLGAERGGFVYDVTTGITKGIPMERSSVFSIATIPNSESTFCLGTRSGKLLHVDIRSKSINFHVQRSKIKHGSGINHLTALNDSNYLISRSMEGNLYLLDLRLQKEVYSWSNPSTRLSFTESFCLDDTQTYLASAGATTRIFDISQPSPDPLFQAETEFGVNHLMWSREWSRRRESGFGALTHQKIEVLPMRS